MNRGNCFLQEMAYVAAASTRRDSPRRPGARRCSAYARNERFIFGRFRLSKPRPQKRMKYQVVIAGRS